MINGIIHFAARWALMHWHHANTLKPQPEAHAAGSQLTPPGRPGNLIP